MVGSSGHDDHTDIIIFMQILGKREAVFARQSNIHNDEFGRIRFHDFAHGNAFPDSCYTIALAAQTMVNDVLNHFIIFDHQDMGFIRHSTSVSF